MIARASIVRCSVREISRGPLSSAARTRSRAGTGRGERQISERVNHAIAL